MTTRIVKDFEQPVYNCTFGFAAGAANHSTVTITVQDKNGNAIGEVMPLMVWFSDDVAGQGEASTGPTGLSCATGGGTYLKELTSKQTAICLTNAAGQVVLDVTDAVTQVYYVAASPLAGTSGFVSTSRIMSADDFGA